MNTSQTYTTSPTLAVGIAAIVLLPVLSVQGNTINTDETTVTATQGNTTGTAVFTQTDGVIASPTPLAVNVNQGAVATVQNPEINTGTVITNLNQENKVFFAPEPTPTPLPTPTPFIAPDPSRNDLVGLLITDERAALRPGEEFEYRIVIKNNNQHDIILDKISVKIPEFVTPLIAGATPGATGDAATRSINWISQRISANAEITYTLVGQVDTVVPNNLTLIATATISGAGVRANASDETQVLSTGVVAATQSTQNVAPTPVTQQQISSASHPPVRITARTGPATAVLTLPAFSILAGLAGLRKFLLNA